MTMNYTYQVMFLLISLPTVASDNGEYVDIVEDRGLGEDIAHATTHAPSPSPRLKPRITSNPPQVILPSTSLDSSMYIVVEYVCDIPLSLPPLSLSPSL